MIDPYISTILGHNKVLLTDLWFPSAQKDCEAAIKLKADYTKAYIHLARALKGLQEEKKALEVLNIAESISQDTLAVIQKYKQEIMSSS